MQKAESFLQHSRKVSKDYLANPLRSMRQGKVNPLPQTERQLKQTKGGESTAKILKTLTEGIGEL